MAAPTELATRLLASALALACGGCGSLGGRDGMACAGNAQSAGACAWPRDVRAFVERRADCDHFRGEEATDPQRARYLAGQLRRSCTGTDAQLARLLARHAGDAAIRQLLSQYEPRIEP